MDEMCGKYINTCLPCQSATQQNVREPLQMSKLPEQPWQEVSVDFCEIVNEYLIVVIDEYSRYPIVEIVSSTSANAIILKLDCGFSMFGIPKVPTKICDICFRNQYDTNNSRHAVYGHPVFHISLIIKQ